MYCVVIPIGRRILLYKVKWTNRIDLSSSELKARAFLIPSHLSVCPSRWLYIHLPVCKLSFIFIFFFRITGSIWSKFSTKHPWVKGFQICSFHVPCPLARVGVIQNSFSQEPLGSKRRNQNWCEIFLRDCRSKLF